MLIYILIVICILIFYFLNLYIRKPIIIDTFASFDKSSCYVEKSTNSSSSCNPSTSSPPNYKLNGIDYSGLGVSITPCLNKSDDFDEWCQYYQSPSTPLNAGYNVNSIGAKYILEGKDGDCYLSANGADGIEDPNSARAVCDYNSIKEIPKLDVINNNLNYNVFTDCNPLSSDFLSSCTGSLNTTLKPELPYTNSDVSVNQIMGYDCNPGYGRGKCVLKSDNVKDVADDANFLKNSIY